MSETTKIFVLDTSVILYDSDALDSFQEHDLAVPITVLEELDSFKKGNHVLNLHAREFIRRLDKLSEHNDLREWLPLNGSEHGRLRVVTEGAPLESKSDLLGSRHNDHRILSAALGLAQQTPQRPVILVSKDINLRVKARALGLDAEDYETVQVRDVAHLYRGKSTLEIASDEPIERLYRERQVPLAELHPPFAAEPPFHHQYFIVRGPEKSALATAKPALGVAKLVEKRPAYGIVPRNAEQTFALDAIADEKVPLVSLSGSAGTGKTLLALAGALDSRRYYRQVYLARPVVPLSNKDLGYLPGDVDAKLSPYMQPLWDNLNVIRNQYAETSREYAQIVSMLETEKLQIVPLAYIRGRSLSKVIFIVDEAQNLTPHEIKTIITRAGEGTKVVFTGDVFQIDTPYLDAQSNGLAYLIDRMKGHPLYAHVNLEKGERSELANVASKLL
jgi:PhoH-like ATPase